MKFLREDILGQLLILRLNENRWKDSHERWLRYSPPGGVLLAESLPPSAESTRKFLDRMARSLPHSPFLAVRQEGGTHDPLGRFFPGLPSPRAAAEKGFSAVAALGDLIGEALSLLGFNTNFAPLLDLATPFTKKTLGPRAFGPDPSHVAACGNAFLRGLRRHKILACGKHFPGLGSVPLQSSQGLAVSGKPMAALWREDLLPYRQLLPHLPMVLVSSAAYKAYDFDRPRAATLSPEVIEGLLRIKLGYRGLVVSCDLESEEVRGLLDLGDAAVQAVNAGCDLLVVDDHADSCESIRRALKAGFTSGKLSPQRVEQALERIHAAKEGQARPSGTIPRGALAQLVRRFEKFCKEFRREELQIA